MRYDFRKTRAMTEGGLGKKRIGLSRKEKKGGARVNLQCIKAVRQGHRSRVLGTAPLDSRRPGGLRDKKGNAVMPTWKFKEKCLAARRRGNEK